VLTKTQEDKILQLLEEKEILYLEIQGKDLEINYLNNKQMESFRLTQALMESNEKLQGKLLAVSKKLDSQTAETYKLQAELDIKQRRLRTWQIATAVTSTIILIKIFLM